MLKLCNIVYWLALTIWVSALMSAGVAAFGAFATLSDATLGLLLEPFGAYDTAQHGRIAAGLVTEPIFTFTDVVQVPLAFFVLVTLALQLTAFRMRWRSAANLVRSIAIVLAVLLFAGRVVFLMPQMNHDLREYRDAAKAGQVETAEQHLAAFNVNHRRAQPMMNLSLVLLLVAVAASGAAMSGAASPKPTRELQSPKLASNP